MGVAQRVGLGKVRHFDTQSLWFQQAVRQRRLGMAKVLGSLSPADAMTKAVDGVTLDGLLGLMALEKRTGRASIAPHMEGADVCTIDQEVPHEVCQDPAGCSTSSSTSTCSSAFFVLLFEFYLHFHVTGVKW